ncbi:MAG TPA: hypothetical protein VEP90_29140, partial [Methylomirabilota bacterium]|nr:hypothetical protein [Methylomirabilota bacterium]
AATTGADTITILLSGAPTFIFFTCLEFSQVQKTLRVVEKTATGTYTSGTSFTAAVTSFTPTVTDLLYAYTGFLACSATGTITYATATGFTAGTGKGTDVVTGSNCITSGSVKFRFNEADQYFPNSGSTATTASFAVADSAPTVGTGGWAEIALELEFKSFQSISNTVTLASAIANPANHPRSLTQTITDASSLGHITKFIKGLTGTITDSASLTALISLFFFHGMSSISCITKPSLVCSYQVFFTEAPNTASATLSVAKHFILLSGTITTSLLLSLRDNYAKAITGAITTIANFQAVANGETCTITFPIPLLCNYNRNLIQSIVTPSSLTKIANHFDLLIGTITSASAQIKGLAESLSGSFIAAPILNVILSRVENLVETITGTSSVTNIANHFIAIIETLTSDSILTAFATTHFFIDIENFIGSVISIEAIVPCNLATGGACNGSAGPAIAFAIIGMGIAIAALYFA